MRLLRMDNPATFINLTPEAVRIFDDNDECVITFLPHRTNTASVDEQELSVEIEAIATPHGTVNVKTFGIPLVSNPDEDATDGMDRKDVAVPMYGITLAKHLTLPPETENTFYIVGHGVQSHYADRREDLVVPFIPVKDATDTRIIGWRGFANYVPTQD